MPEKAFQEYYPNQLAYCYGCGHLNEHGHRIKSYWDGDETVCVFAAGPMMRSAARRVCAVECVAPARVPAACPARTIAAA